MENSIVSRNYLRALSPKDAEEKFSRINTNPDNIYQSGYEHYLNYLPVIHGPNDPDKAEKLRVIEYTFDSLANHIDSDQWAFNNWPEPGKLLNRVILAIDEITGGEIILARWNKGETPIHGHGAGQMIDYVLTGKVEQREYQLINAVTREVKEVDRIDIFSFNPIFNDYHDSVDSSAPSAMIHKFVFLTKTITLHYSPSHPRDGRGSTFNEPKKYLQ